MIVEPYLLTVCVPVKVDASGNRWTDTLWAKDLALHLDHIENLTLASPRIFALPSDSDVRLSGDPFDRIKFVDLPQPINHLQALKTLPETIKKMWQAVRCNAIVHTGFGGWPISEGLLVTPIAILQRKFLVTNVESSFWRASGDANWHNKIRSVVLERLNRWCIRSADLRFFTSQSYMNDFLAAGSPRAYVIPATWIDESTILTDSDARNSWSKKTGKIKLLFAGRLTDEKGVRYLLEAAPQFPPNSSLSIIGEGPLLAECATAQRVLLLNPITYGPEFFALLRQFDAVIVPSLSGEQPRIVFDAFSQAVPVLGSNTGGIREVVETETNGVLFPAGDANAIVEAINRCPRERLRKMGLEALKKARQFTHRSMHEERARIIARAICASGAASLN